jgi:hypothetical protein
MATFTPTGSIPRETRLEVGVNWQIGGIGQGLDVLKGLVAGEGKVLPTHGGGKARARRCYGPEAELFQFSNLANIPGVWNDKELIMHRFEALTRQFQISHQVLQRFVSASCVRRGVSRAIESITQRRSTQLPSVNVGWQRTALDPDDAVDVEVVYLEFRIEQTTCVVHVADVGYFRAQVVGPHVCP